MQAEEHSRPASGRERRGEANGVTLGFGLAFGLTATALGLAMMRLEPNLLEEGLLLYAAERMHEGERLFRDIASFTGPFPFELLSVLFRVFGDEIFVARGAVAVLQGAAAAAAFGLARRAGAGTLAHVIGVFMASLSVLLFPFYSVYFYTVIALQLSVVAAYTAVRALASTRFAVATGVLVACVALSKQTVGLVLAVGLVTVLAVRAPKGSRARTALATASGGLAVAVLTLAFYGLRGDLGIVFESLVLLPLTFTDTFTAPYMNLWPPGKLSPEIRPNTIFYLPHIYTLTQEMFFDVPDWMVGVTQILYALPALALVATGFRMLRGGLSDAQWIHTALFVANASNLFPRTDWGHLAYVLPSCVVQLLLVALRRDRSAPTGDVAFWGAISASGAIGVAVLFVGSALFDLAGAPIFGPRVPLHPVSALHRSGGAAYVIHYLRQRVEPGDAIFVARAEPLVYFATETRNPTPYGGVIPGIRERQEAAILAALPDVRFVVMSDLDQPVYTYYRDELPRVVDHLERHFRVVGEFTGPRVTWISVLEPGPDRGEAVVDLVKELPNGTAWIMDDSGQRRAVAEELPRLPAKLNRRPLPLVLGPRGGGIDFEVEIPEHAVFQASVGVRTLVGFPLIYEHPTQTRFIASIGSEGGFRRIAAVLIDYRKHDGGHWTELSADLSEWAGKRVTLRLQSLSRIASEGRVSWWGSPRIAVRPDPDPAFSGASAR